MGIVVGGFGWGGGASDEAVWGKWRKEGRKEGRRDIQLGSRNPKSIQRSEPTETQLFIQ